MELRLLRYFLTVAKEQSFTKAAVQLHITQPTLSRQMVAFEEALGVTLFNRSGKKISLTEEGILLKRRALEILNLEEKRTELLDVVQQCMGEIHRTGGGDSKVKAIIDKADNYYTQQKEKIADTKSLNQIAAYAMDCSQKLMKKCRTCDIIEGDIIAYQK